MKLFFQNLNIILFSVLVSISSQLSSQNNTEPVCGTITSNETLDYFNKLKPQIKKYEALFLSSKSAQNKSKSLTKSLIPIKAHVIRKSNGDGGLSEYELEDAIIKLNETFADAFMEFFLCSSIDYIDSNAFYHFKSNEEKSLVDAHNVSGVINIYFTDHIENSSDENICGYTYNKKDYDVIIMQNSCAMNDSSLAHELGHYFSLIHTHGIDNDHLTTELVNGSNCSSDGDQICDTPADPKLTVDNVNNFCRYIGTETDANGDAFSPDTGNIMSYSMKGCRSHFSEQQLARMYAYYQSTKNYLACGNTSSISKSIETDPSNALDIKIFPNPVSGNMLYIKPNNSEAVLNFKISNLMGQVVVSGKLTNQPILLNHLASGTYLITIRSNNTKVVKRLIK